MTLERAEEVFSFLEAEAKRSRTGISIDWVPAFEGEPAGFRFMRRHFIGPVEQTVVGAIIQARNELASAGEAGTAETAKTGSVHEHATAESGDAQTPVPSSRERK